MTGPREGRPCVWPACLTEEQHEALLDAVQAVEKGLQPAVMPDQRLVCRCEREDVKT